MQSEGRLAPGVASSGGGVRRPRAFRGSGTAGLRLGDVPGFADRGAFTQGSVRAGCSSMPNLPSPCTPKASSGNSPRKAKAAPASAEAPPSPFGPPRPSALRALRPGPHGPEGGEGGEGLEGPRRRPRAPTPLGTQKTTPPKNTQNQGGSPPQFGLKFLKTPSIRGSTPLILGGHF